MRHSGETSKFQVRGSGEDHPSVAPRSPKTPDREDWVWMVDEDPAFYLSETAGA